MRIPWLSPWLPYPIHRIESMHAVNCNICDTDKTALVTVQNDYRIVQCRNCRLVYVNPRPDREMLIELYANYHQRNGKNEFSWVRLMQKNFKEVSAILKRIYPGGGSLLDIGCGYGYFIELMRDSGWSVCGIDPSSKAVWRAKEKGLPVMETTIEEFTIPGDAFDAITAFYVLEHLEDPLSVTRKILSFLKPGGIFIMRVPHTTPIIRILSAFGISNALYDPPFHLYDFSPATIETLLKKAGFSSIRIMPGCPTCPANRIERIISILSGNLSKLLFIVSAGMFLLPGTSKTIFALRNGERLSAEKSGSVSRVKDQAQGV